MLPKRFGCRSVPVVVIFTTLYILYILYSLYLLYILYTLYVLYIIILEVITGFLNLHKVQAVWDCFSLLVSAVSEHPWVLCAVTSHQRLKGDF